MRNLTRIFILICALCCASTAFSKLPMGGWRTFFNYSNVGGLTQSKDKVYALSRGNLFSVDKEYESVETYTKLTGLTDGNISTIAFCQSQNTLVIVYDNCNIDLLNGSHVVNVTDLKRAEVSNKKVNGITIRGNYAYLACGFGILVLDVARAEIIDTYILGEGGQYVNVENIVFHNDTIFAQSGKNIRYASLKEKNLADFNAWENFYLYKDAESGKRSIVKTSGKDSLSLSGDILPVAKLFSFGNSLMMRSDDVLLKVEADDSIVSVRDLLPSTKIAVDNRLNIMQRDSMIAYDTDIKIVTSIAADSVMEAIYDPQGKAYWICSFQKDGRTVLQKFDEKGVFLNSYTPNGPSSKEIAFVKYQNGKLFTGSGGPFDRALNSMGIVQICENDKWSIITEVGMDPEILGKNHFLDVLDIAIDPSDNNHFFVASWKGLFEFQGFTMINNFDETNSPISANSVNIIVDGLKYDKDGNLWMLNLLSSNPIHILTPDREWKQLNYPRIQNQEGLRDLFFDSKGYLWVILYRKGPGVYCVDMNGTPMNEYDDKKTFLSSFHDKDGHTLTPTTVMSIAEDNDGVVWIGTDKGPVLIPDASKAFDSDFVVDRVKITRADNSDYADYLLENEQINAIAVDGSNRKWVGTNSTGLYLLSPDGKETIRHFTTENSPLTSNVIMDLFLDRETGELFIVSSTGLFLYQSDAISGAKSYNNVHVYPNPVRENYDGPITITGLRENSQVRVSDSEGRIIHEGDSNGGVYVWDGNDLNGRRVDTGIYFIYAALPDGSSKMVTKIAVIK